MTVKDLKKKAPKGEFLAYINKEEAAALKRAGGSGHLVNGIPSFVGSDYSEKGNANKSGYQGGNRGKGGYQGSTGKTNQASDGGEGGSGGNFNPNVTAKGTTIRTGDLSSDLQTYNNNIATNLAYKNPYGPVPYNAREKKLQKFYNTRPKVNLLGFSKMFEKPIQKFSDFTTEKNRSFFEDVIRAGKIPGLDFGTVANMDEEELEAAYQDYMSNRLSGATDAYGNPISGGNDNSNQPYIPINYNTEAAEEVEEKKYDYRMSDVFDGSQNVIYDQYGDPGYRTTAAEGGIMGTRARRAMGGIMNRVDKRQGYFLGKIVKGVKGVVGGVVDATKKVLKSDLGKAALIYGGGAMLGSYGAGKGFFSPGMFNPANMGRGLLGTKGVGMAGGTSGLFGKIGLTEGFGALMPTLKGAGVLGLGALGLFGNKAAPNETSFSDRGGRLKNSQGQEGNQAIRDEIYEAYESGDQDRIMQLQKFYGYKLPALNAVADLSLPSSLPYPNYAEGGRIGKAEGGLMDLGGMEKDYRAEGGFVPIGEYEKKDDVPARLSVNEFVFTADAVRGAGGGDIDKGAEIMENMMENLENGGTISEESQGNKGAQQMFETSERLGAVI